MKILFYSINIVLEIVVEYTFDIADRRNKSNNAVQLFYTKEQVNSIRVRYVDSLLLFVSVEFDFVLSVIVTCSPTVVVCHDRVDYSRIMSSSTYSYCACLTSFTVSYRLTNDLRGNVSL
jgi:hypothetical protein